MSRKPKDPYLWCSRSHPLALPFVDMPTSSQLGASRQVPVQVPGGHGRLVTCTYFYPDGNKLVSGSCDKMLSIWDQEKGAVEVFTGVGGRAQRYITSGTICQRTLRLGRFV
ncbi:hypothetical protein BS17DRAFT_523248 [Gyrodon lividus]|nr:hypothetical protein BS17DRAFT_523248 [Gyrodon lividus]